MSNNPDHNAAADLPGASSGVITHTYIRLRGTQQCDDITVYHARTKIARVTLRWSGILMSFLNAKAAQGVLEGFSAARPTLPNLPAEVPPVERELYDRPTIAIDWTSRPGYAVMPKDAVTPDKRRTIHWTDATWGPSHSRSSTAPPSTAPSTSYAKSTPQRWPSAWTVSASARTPPRTITAPSCNPQPPPVAALIHSRRCGPSRVSAPPTIVHP